MSLEAINTFQAFELIQNIGNPFLYHDGNSRRSVNERLI